MNRHNQQRPQVPGDTSGCAGVDGRHASPGVRGAKNFRVRSDRQTTLAKVIKDTDTLNVLSYNVRTLMSDERLIELENALKYINWDIVGLGEVRRLGENTEERHDDVFFHFGETSGHHGVGFLVAKKWKDNIIEFKGYSERIAALRLRVTSKTTLTLIQIYAPTSTHCAEEVETFYDLLNRACDENQGTWNMVLGDFNAKLGTRQATDTNSVIGQFGLGNRNERGTRLIQFAFGQRMNVANSFFSKKPSRRWTWVTPNGVIRNEIDFILSSDLQIIKDVNVINNIKFSSDHRPVRAIIRFNFKIHRFKRYNSKLVSHSKLTLFKNSDDFNIELSNQFSSLNINEIEDAEGQYKTIIKSIERSSKKIKQVKRDKAKLSNETKKLISDREKTEICTSKYSTLDKQVKRSIRKDIRAFNSKLIEIAIEKHTSLRSAMKGFTTGKHWINSLQDETGIKQNSRDKIMNICTKFYKTLYSDASKSDETMEYVRSVPFFTGKEVHNALKTMKYDRSPGEDGITSEALKIGSPALLPHLTNLFNTILDSGQLPKQMCHSNIVLLHKKGDKSNIGNYRPISLVSHLYKAFIKTIQNRIAASLDKHQPPEQAGFRPCFSTSDHLHTLNQIIEKYSEFSKPLYLAFVDYTKAFDSVKHSAIFTALKNQKIDDTYIKLLKLVYSNSTADIKLNITGPKFSIEKGVKQGDPLSPILFTATLQEIFKPLDIKWTAKGIDVGGKRLTNLRFADDIVLFAATAHDLQEMLEDLSRASLEVGLQMNRSKTQIMTNSTRRRVEVDGQEIQYVDEYIYLGQLASFENRQDKEIGRRIENAWKSYWSMKAHMKGDLPLTLKRKLIDMCILPVLTYGAQTWSLTELQKSKLKICQRAMERSILGFKRIDRVRNTMLRSLTGIADVGAKAARLKWDWAGHVSRMPPDRWATISTPWVPDGRRSRGRPRKRWRDDIDSFERSWWEEARERDKWKSLGETFAQQWDKIG